MNATLTDTEARLTVDALAVQIAHIDETLRLARRHLPALVKQRDDAAELHARLKAELGEAHVRAHVEAARRVA